jgi:tRNA-dihydrouridine synthase C
MTRPPIRIDSLALAPMEGVTDEIVRALFAELGALDYVVTEFIRVSSEVLSPKILYRHCPELRQGCVVHDVPVHLQLLGGDPSRMAESAAIAHALGASWIDLNFGCPAPTVNRHDGGATLLKDPARVFAVTRAVRDALAPSATVSAKVRLGWAHSEAIVDIARAVEEGGASLLTVHGRTRVQGYAPPADWAAIGRAREALSIPVVANGDLDSPEALWRCQRESGCARFMLGRGALARPELFRVLRGRDAPWSTSARLALVQRYIDRCVAMGPGRERLALARGKQWLRLMSVADEGARALFERCKRHEALSAFRAELAAAVAVAL